MSVNAAGADRQIQFNNSGAFGADANFVFSSAGYLGVGVAIPQAQLDVGGTGSILIPRGTQVQRPAGVNGMMRYNNTSNRFEVYQAGAWQDMLTGAASGSFLTLTDTPSSYAGSANQYVRVNAATNALEFTNQLVGTFTGQPAPDFMGLGDLSDVNLGVAPTNGQTLVYDNATSRWIAGSPTSAAAGAEGNLQFNVGGALGANSEISVYGNNLYFGLSTTSHTVVDHSGGNSYSARLNVVRAGGDTVGGIHVGLHGPSLGTNPDMYALIGQRRNGSSWDAGTAVAAGQYLPGIAFAGQSDATHGDGHGVQIGAAILGLVDGTVSSGVVPTSIVMRTSKTGHDGLTEYLRITSAGDVVMSGTGAMTVLRGTDAERPTTPADGMFRYNSTRNRFEGYQNGGWQDILTGAATVGAAGTTGQVQFNDNGNLAASAGLAFSSATGALSVGNANTVVLQGAATGENPVITSGGSDTNVGLTFDTKGSGGFRFIGGNYNPVTFEAINDAFIVVKGNTSASRAGVSLRNDGSNQWNIIAHPGNNELQFIFSNNVNASPNYMFKGSGDLYMQGTGALALNAGTSAQRPGTPRNGMLRYNTTSDKFEAYQDGAWINIVGSSAAAGANSQIQYNNNGYMGANANFVFDANGKVGIGTDTPRSRLDLSEATGVSSYFRLRSGSVTLPSYSGSSTLNELSGGNTILNMGMSTGPQNNTFNMGGAIVHGLTASGANAWSPLYLLGTHGGTAPTLAAVTIAGQRHNGSTNRTALTGTMPILDVMSFYDNSSTYLAMRVQANGDLTVANNINYSGTLTDTSDMRLKTDIHPLRNRGSMLDKIGQIDTYSFRMKSNKDGQVEFGVMAQELEHIFPELVETNTSTPENYLSVNYIGLIAPLVQATQELKAENDNLKSQLSSLESKMASIEADMKGMKAYTGYGIGKAGFGLGMAGGMALIGGLAGALLLNRRRKAA